MLSHCQSYSSGRRMRFFKLEPRHASLSTVRLLFLLAPRSPLITASLQTSTVLINTDQSAPVSAPFAGSLSLPSSEGIMSHKRTIERSSKKVTQHCYQDCHCLVPLRYGPEKLTPTNHSETKMERSD